MVGPHRVRHTPVHRYYHQSPTYLRDSVIQLEFLWSSVSYGLGA